MRIWFLCFLHRRLSNENKKLKNGESARACAACSTPVLDESFVCCVSLESLLKFWIKSLDYLSLFSLFRCWPKIRRANVRSESPLRFGQNNLAQPNCICGRQASGFLRLLIASILFAYLKSTTSDRPPVVSQLESLKHLFRTRMEKSECIQTLTRLVNNLLSNLIILSRSDDSTRLPSRGLGPRIESFALRLSKTLKSFNSWDYKALLVPESAFSLINYKFCASDENARTLEIFSIHKLNN